jgi:hypothetical protein
MSGLSLDPWAPSARAWSSRYIRFAQHQRTIFRSDPDDGGGQQRFFVVHANGDVQMLLDSDALDRLLERLDAAARNGSQVAAN